MDLKAVTADIPPASFAAVMATGIVSIASHLLGFSYISNPLLVLNIVFYVVLWTLTVARSAVFSDRLVSDFRDHSRGVGFFTMIAGTCVLGNQIVVLLDAYAIASGLWILGTVLWALLIYGVFFALAVQEQKPLLDEGINGLWLVSIVATQSVSILGCTIADRFSAGREAILFFSLSLFLAGGVLYILLITLIFYRFMFFPLKPEALGPPYWINMGAAAISTLAGATLIVNSKEGTFLLGLLPFTKGLTVFFWAIATWWIPLLVLLGIWRYLVRGVKIAYDPQYWGMVFPLGMYTTCTFHLAQALELDFLLAIPRYFIYAALLSWILTFVGLLRAVVHALRPDASAR